MTSKENQKKASKLELEIHDRIAMVLQKRKTP